MKPLMVFLMAYILASCGSQESSQVDYIPGEKITVDEAMIKCKSRCGFLQHMPAKPTKCGLKFGHVATPRHTSC